MTDTATLPALTPAELSTESIAGDAFPWRRGKLQALPWAIDDISRDFGDDIYQRMLLDPTVAAAHDTLRAAILAQGMRLTPAITDPTADGYDLANEIAAFCSAVLDAMETPLDDVLWDMLMALAFGSRVAELVWAYTPPQAWYPLDASTAVSPSQSLLTLRAIKPKPRHATAFVVDAYTNLIGLLPLLSADGTRPATGWWGMGGGPLVRSAGPRFVAGEGSGQAISEDDLISPEKFFIFSYHPENSDPRGTSAYRAVYTPWNLKQQIYPEWFKFLAQFASPSIYAVLGEKAADVRSVSGDGSVTVTRAADAMLTTLLNFQNGSAAVFPYGTLLSLIQSTGKGDAFLSAFAHCDQQIALAALHQTLATLEGAHESRAASETHKDTLDLMVQQARGGLCLAAARDIVQPLVRYNYGDLAATRLCPIPELGSVDLPDIPKLMQAIAQLASAQYLDISQLPGIDTMLQLPQRAQPEEPDAPAEPDDGGAA